MTTMHDGRQFIAREGREIVLLACRRREREGDVPKANHHELYRGTFRALFWGACTRIWLLCVLLIVVAFFALEHNDGGTFFIEALFLLLFIVINAFLVAIQQVCDRRELMRKALEIIDSYGTESSTYEADLKFDDCENVAGSENECSGIKLGSTWESLVLAYRDETWQRLPEVLLIEGDIIALSCGDMAPGRLRPLSWSEKMNNWVELEVEIPKGKKICHEWSAEGFNIKNGCPLQATSPELLRLFGDVKCYRILDTPLLDYLTKIMSDTESHGEQTRTLLRSRLEKTLRIALYLAFIFVVLTFLTGGIRLILQRQSAPSVLSVTLFFNPANAVLCLLPITLPIYLILGEALTTAHLLLYFGKPMKSPSKYTHRRVSKTTVQTGSTFSPKNSMHSMYSHEYDELDVRERITARRKMHSSIPIKLELYQMWRVLRAWVSRSLNHNVPTAAMQSNDVSTEKTWRMMPIPLRRACLVDRLGCVTSFCVLDEEVVCKPYSIVEEVFILNPMKRTDALTTSHSSSLPYTVLDLYTGEDRDANLDIVAGAKFEDTQWWTRLSSLKPIGFTCLVAEGKSSKLDSSFPTTSSEIHSNVPPSSKSSNVYGYPEVKLIEYSQRLPSFRALQQLACEMGFNENKDMANFRRVHKIGIVHPRLGARSMGNSPRTVGLEETWLRGIFNPHVRSHVIKDRRTGSLHCMSEGSPPLLLDMCVDYWDGASISAIPDDLHSTILEVYRKWTQEDFDVTAFACAPVPCTLTAMLCGKDAIRPPDYLVYSINAPTSPTGRRQKYSLKHCDNVISPSNNTGDRTCAISRVFPSKSPDLPQRYSESCLLQMSDLTAEEISRASTVAQVYDVWETLHDQVFLGMVASSCCPVKAIPCLIEDLSALGVRFLYFSPRNMRRTKATADKMGLFTDWNCAISLRPLDEPNMPDPNRMTSTCDWDVNARLPHGTAAIRKHIKEVDNVPLLVSLFTDSTPQTVREMIDILQECHETVLCIGTGYRLANMPAFDIADLSVVREALPAGQEVSTLPHYSKRRLSLLDMHFCQNISSLYAVFPLRASPPDEHMDCRLNSLTDTIHEGSRVLHNIYQALAFVAIASTSMAFIPVLSMMIPATIPLQLNGVHLIWLQLIIMPILGFSLLYTPQINTSVFNRMPEKLSPEVMQSSSGYVLQALVCAFLLTFGVVSVSTFMFGLYFELEDVSTASECSGRYSLKRINLLFCPNWLDNVSDKSIIKSRNIASDLMIGILVIGWICYSGCLQYRLSSPFERPPWRSRVWVAAACITACLQFMYCLGMAALLGAINTLLSRSTLRAIGVICIWIAFCCGAMEMFRRYNARGYNRSQTLLRLEFDTRLGMHSPRYYYSENHVVWMDSYLMRY